MYHCVSVMPPTGHTFTASRFTWPPSTGTTKVTPKPTLTTTPEVSELAKRQSDAESTTQSFLSPKYCRYLRSTS